eukprot:Opistho-2@87226
MAKSNNCDLDLLPSFQYSDLDLPLVHSSTINFEEVNGYEFAVLVEELDPNVPSMPSGQSVHPNDVEVDGDEDDATDAESDTTEAVDDDEPLPYDVARMSDVDELSSMLNEFRELPGVFTEFDELPSVPNGCERCGQCSKVLKKSSMAYHIQTHGPAIHPCDAPWCRCSRLFKSYASVFMHRRRSSRNPDKLRRNSDKQDLRVTRDGRVDRRRHSDY